MIRRVLSISLILISLMPFLYVCYTIGYNIKQEQIKQEQQAEKERQFQMKLGTAEMVGRAIERSHNR